MSLHMLRTVVVGALALVVAFGSGLARAEEISGSGSTFVFPILSRWGDDYGAQSADKISYQPIGSSGGVMQIKSGMVDFGASDMPLASAELDQARLAQFPIVIGGVIAVVNIAGIKPGQLHFTGPLLADIFLGKVSSWSAPEIRALNPGVPLPDAKITVIHRSDGSGTTFNWVNYLSKVSPEWKAKVGEGPSVSWPTGVAASGNVGVATTVNRIKNSIGYVEYAYVVQNRMSHGAIQNRAKAALKFFQWALTDGQQRARSLAYVPLPEPWSSRSRRTGSRRSSEQRPSDE